MLHPSRTLALSLFLCFAVAAAAAAPYIPGADDEVLERLPERNDPSLPEIKRLRAELDTSPKDPSLAVRLAHRAIEASRKRAIRVSLARRKPRWRPGGHRTICPQRCCCCAPPSARASTIFLARSPISSADRQKSSDGQALLTTPRCSP
jgi:hypothetical protein